MRCIAKLFLLHPDRRMATTAALSHRTLIVLPCHCRPHTALATTMGRSSFTVIYALTTMTRANRSGTIGHYTQLHSPKCLRRLTVRWQMGLRLTCMPAFVGRSNLLRRQTTTVGPIGTQHSSGYGDAVPLPLLTA